MNLIAVFSQRLAKRRDGKGRIPVVEVMMITPLARKYILDGDFDKLKGLVGNRDMGSQSFDQHLAELFQKAIDRRCRSQAAGNQRRCVESVAARDREQRDQTFARRDAIWSFYI